MIGWFILLLILFELFKSSHSNYGGFSLRRLLGISAAKSRISRAVGVPLFSRSGRERKLGAFVFRAVFGRRMP